MAGRPRRVFLSHTSELREFPQDRSFVTAAEAAVIRSGDAVIDMAYFTARDSQPADYCRQMVARADTHVGLIGFRYGSPVADRPELSHTELEFETATQLRLPRLIFIIRETARGLPAVGQSPEHAARQQAFRQRLQEAGVTIAWIGSPAELELDLFQALAELKTGSESRALPPEPRAGIPPDPIEHFAGREAELAELRRQLELHSRVVLHGLGGVGKTQLAVRYVHQHGDDLLLAACGPGHEPGRGPGQPGLGAAASRAPAARAGAADRGGAALAAYPPALAAGAR